MKEQEQEEEEEDVAAEMVGVVIRGFSCVLLPMNEMQHGALLKGKGGGHSAGDRKSSQKAVTLDSLVLNS